MPDYEHFLAVIIEFLALAPDSQLRKLARYIASPATERAAPQLAPGAGDSRRDEVDDGQIHSCYVLLRCPWAGDACLRVSEGTGVKPLHLCAITRWHVRV